MANFCNLCGSPLPIGSGSTLCTKHGGPPLAPDAIIKCPFCSEQILASAKKCKHCGEFLDKINSRTPKIRQAGDIICSNPHCHYEGPPIHVAFGSVVIGSLRWEEREG
jgi:hypothetical protein